MYYSVGNEVEWRLIKGGGGDCAINWRNIYPLFPRIYWSGRLFIQLEWRGWGKGGRFRVYLIKDDENLV